MSDESKPLLPAEVRAVIDRVRAFAKGLSKPARVLVVSTAIVAALGLAWLGFRSAYEPYATLFAQLDREDAGAIVAKLKEQKIPYRVTGDGGAIEVPEARVHEVRLDLASAGLPRGGGVGFEGFDKMKIGATEFEQRVMYRRAMEGELARTITSLEAVKEARVHLVLPEQSVFAMRREPASASVVVRLRQGRALGPSEVASIVHLVAAAVPGLAAERVALTTTDGAMLHKPRAPGEGPDADASGTDPDRLAQAHVDENRLEERVRSMLDRTLGPGHFDVRVTADFDLAKHEQLEDHYDPQKIAPRSKEDTIERAGAPNDDTTAGVPGAESNLPDEKPGGGAAPAGSGNVLRETHTVNNEVDHVQIKRSSTSPELKRLSVAVAIDGVPGQPGFVPRSKEEIDRIQRLVRGAVLADDKRGDVVTVECMPFAPPDAAPADAEAPPLVPIPDKFKKWVPLAKVGLGVLGGLIALLMLRRMLKKRGPAAELALAKQSLQLGAKLDDVMAAKGEGDAQTPVLEGQPEPPKLPEVVLPEDQREEAIRRASVDPATAALVLRRWLGTSLEESTQAAPPPP